MPERAAGKVFQRCWMVLKRRVVVGLTRMAGVARFGEQAQIAQAQLPYQLLVRSMGGVWGAPRRIQLGQDKQQQQDCQQRQSDVRPAVCGKEVWRHRASSML